MRESSTSQFGFAAMLVGAVGIAFAPNFVRSCVANYEIGTSATAFYRVFFALPVLWLWSAMEQRGPNPPRRPSTPREKRLLLIAGIFFALDMAFWHWSIKLTTVANSTLLANFAPIVVTLGAWMILKEKITGTFVLAMVIALAGASMLAGSSLQLTPKHLIGDGLAIVTALFYGSYQLTVKLLRSSFSPATIMSWSGVSAGAALLVIALLSGDSMLPNAAGGWWMLLALALISHVAGQGLIAYAFGHLPASFGSLSLLLQPMLAALIAWAWFSEKPGPLQAAGGLVMLTGLFIATRNRPAEERRTSTEDPQ
ncbi:MAG: drug/metabolite transporter (DMT)-like permease [Limisphaerales bacterium]|jgi:drug/metabolite transporter (DMT)-like permease